MANQMSILIAAVNENTATVKEYAKRLSTYSHSPRLYGSSIGIGGAIGTVDEMIAGASGGAGGAAGRLTGIIPS